MTFYNEGWDASARGESECPYRPHTASYKYWWMGWNDHSLYLLERAAA
jgi:hypothetical protein